jgi:hypothetical protein
MLLVTQYKMATSTITLRTIDGQNRTMTVSSDMKIIDLKRKIADEFPNFAVGSQRLIYRGCVLEDAKRLPDYCTLAFYHRHSILQCRVSMVYVRVLLKRFCSCIELEPSSNSYQ